MASPTAWTSRARSSAGVRDHEPKASQAASSAVVAWNELAAPARPTTRSGAAGSTLTMSSSVSTEVPPMTTGASTGVEPAIPANTAR